MDTSQIRQEGSIYWEEGKLPPKSFPEKDIISNKDLFGQQF